MKQKLLTTLRLRFALLVALLCSLGTGTAWATDYSVTYTYANQGTSWNQTNFDDASTYWKSSNSKDCIALISGIFSGKNITSDVVITMDVATYGSGDNPTSSKFSIYTSSALTTQVTATQSGTLPSSSTYVNTTYTISKANATSNFTDDLAIKIASGTKLIRFRSFTVEFSYTAAKTITAVSNNDSWGTVSGTSTITASPSSGYRVAADDGGYTVTEGTATVVNNGDNTFSVTPTTDCTVQINFEAIPSYTLSSAVTPAAAGTVTLGATSVLEGSTTTAEAAAAAGYKFTGWSISGEDATLSSTSTNPTTVTMGTENATVTATFEAVTTYEINWSVNGSIVKTENVEENADLDFSAPASGVPAGYAFKGWVVEANKIVGTTDTDPKSNYVTSGKSTANITYYAVMAVDTQTPTTTHLTGDEIASNFAATAMKYADDEATYSDTSEGMTWGARCITNATRHWIQLKSDNDVYIKAVAPQNITGVKVKISNATNSSGGIDDISKHGAFSGTVNLDKVQDTNSGACGYAASSAIVDNILTISADGKSKTIYIHVTGAARVWNVDVTYNTTSTSHFCTTVPTTTVSLASACTDGEGKYYGTYSNSKAFVVPADVTVSEIKVKDGKLDVSSYSTGDIVPANTGVMLSSTTAGSHTLTLAAGGTSILNTNNMLKPSGDAGISAANMTAADTKFYRLTMHNGTDLGFWWGAASGAAFDLAANKAYLAVPAAAAVKSFMWFEDNETAIDGLTPDPSLSKRGAEIYNLAGQRLQKLQRGVNIVNGKKIIMK